MKDLNELDRRAEGLRAFNDVLEEFGKLLKQDEERAAKEKDSYLKEWLNKIKLFREFESVEMMRTEKGKGRIIVNLKSLDFVFDIAHAEDVEGEHLEHRFKEVVRIMLEVANNSEDPKTIVRRVKGAFEVCPFGVHADNALWKVSNSEEQIATGKTQGEAWSNALNKLIDQIIETHGDLIDWQYLEGEYTFL